MANFLHRNPIFHNVVCINMLLTWHKNNNLPNLWLDSDCQLEDEDIYKNKIATYIHQIYNNGLLKLKKWNGLLFMPLYTCIFVYKFYLGYIIGFQYMKC